MSNVAEARRGSEWLQSWDPENEETWDKRLAWTTLWITTFTLTLCFASWFLASAIAPKLTNLGFDFTQSQLYWLTSMPGLAGGLMRLVWMVLPPIMGTRKMVTLTTLLLLFPVLGWGVRVQDTSTPYWELLVLSFLSGIGGGAFSGFMPSTSYFFPRRLQGTALGLQAGIGNFGVSLVQLLTPWIIGFSMIGFLGGSQTMQGLPGKPAPPRSGTRTPRSSTSRSSSSARSWLDDAEVGADHREHQAAVRHLQEPGHLVDDADLHHDLRHVLRSRGAVRPAHEEPLRRGQPRTSCRAPGRAPSCSWRATASRTR